MTAACALEDEIIVSSVVLTNAVGVDEIFAIRANTRKDACVRGRPQEVVSVRVGFN